MNLKLKKGILILILSILCGVGSALALKAAVGVGAYEALAMSFSYLTHIPVGTVGIVFNCLCVLGQFLILKKRFNLQHLLQVPLSIFLGQVMNFVFYDLLDKLIITSYWVNLVLLIFSLVWLAGLVSLIMEINFVIFALEGLCQAVAENWNIKFSTLRQSVDVFCVILSILLTYLFNLPWTVREGTIIGALIMGPLMGIFMKSFRPALIKRKLIDGKTLIE